MILGFLKDVVDKGKAFSIIKVYLAAISACHIGFEVKATGQHPLVFRFTRGAHHRLAVPEPLAPSWDLLTVLDALLATPFEPLEQVELKMLTLSIF